jgi:NAD(P)-dependent dehydrogenase (short-subunit alcohol dehydrogenase family)
VSRPLHGRLALVTGSGRNLGRAIVLQLAEAGADVAVNARSTRQEAEAVADEARGRDVRAVVELCDVGCPAAVASMFESIAMACGRMPDILVNNAAVRRHEQFLDISAESWDTVLRSILGAAFHCARLVLPGMVAQGWGRIVNVTGQAAFAGHEDMAHVVAAKAGLHGLTKALAREFGPYGITVDRAGVEADTSRRAATIPVRRVPRPEDIARTCVYLVTEPGYVTGQAIHVNGGDYLAS